MISPCPTCLRCSVPILLLSAADQLISWYWRYQALSGGDQIRGERALSANYGKTSIYTSEKLLACPFLKHTSIPWLSTQHKILPVKASHWFCSLTL